MYVEISGRGTGKTTRMVDDIVNFLETNGDKSALVVAPTNSTRRLIKEMIFQKCGLSCLNRTITSHRMLPPGRTMKQYVDEFFHVPEKYLLVDKNTYYTGTPKDETINGIYEEIYTTYKNQLGDIVVIKPLKKHGFTRNN